MMLLRESWPLRKGNKVMDSEAERGRGREGEGVWCVRHVGSIHRLRVKMGRIGSWAWLSRSASLPPWPRWEWLTLVTTVNVARQASMKRPEWPWSDELPVTSTATSRYAFAISYLAGVVGPSTMDVYEYMYIPSEGIFRFLSPWHLSISSCFLSGDERERLDSSH